MLLPNYAASEESMNGSGRRRRAFNERIEDVNEGEGRKGEKSGRNRDKASQKELMMSWKSQ